MEKGEKIDARLEGVGNLIKSTRFAIPNYQRPYSWTDVQVKDLLKDIWDAVSNNAEDYFLGTIVTTRSGEDSRMTIIDGQQRLITVSIIFAAIRDFFSKKGQSERSQYIERDYLYKADIRSLSPMPHILLAPEDRDFFTKKIATYSNNPQTLSPLTVSQANLLNAVKLCHNFIDNISQTTNKPDEKFLDLLDFLTEKTKVVWVSVNSESSAFLIFEVLNDRGLDLSVVDLLKNYFFKTAGKRLEEAKILWEKINTLISDLGSDVEFKTFIRQAWSSKSGPTREKDLYDEIKNSIQSNDEAIELLNYFHKIANIQSAFSNSSHEYWQAFDDPNVIEYIEALNYLKLTQSRPLLYSVLSNFKNEEIIKSLHMIVAWSVRSLICGSAGSGTLETAYSESAKSIIKGDVKSAYDLYEEMKDKVPNDEDFKRSFAIATVSNTILARYYLTTLEKEFRKKNEELFVNTNPDKVNLEHILPKSKSDSWSHFSDEKWASLYKRIGNLTLLSKKLNSKAANESFQTKKTYYDQSEILLTKDLCKFDEWTAKEIDMRQSNLAELAVRAWPAKPF